jgi:hypothetical protein
MLSVTTKRHISSSPAKSRGPLLNMSEGRHFSTMAMGGNSKLEICIFLFLRRSACTYCKAVVISGGGHDRIVSKTFSVVFMRIG